MRISFLDRYLGFTREYNLAGNSGLIPLRLFLQSHLFFATAGRQ